LKWLKIFRFKTDTEYEKLTEVGLVCLGLGHFKQDLTGTGLFTSLSSS